jgi:hypothetical protein
MTLIYITCSALPLCCLSVVFVMPLSQQLARALLTLGYKEAKLTTTVTLRAALVDLGTAVSFRGGKAGQGVKLTTPPPQLLSN